MWVFWGFCGWGKEGGRNACIRSDKLEKGDGFSQDLFGDSTSLQNEVNTFYETTVFCQFWNLQDIKHWQQIESLCQCIFSHTLHECPWRRTSWSRRRLAVRHHRFAPGVWCQCPGTTVKVPCKIVKWGKDIPSSKLTWLDGKSGFSIGNYIFNRSVFQPAMLFFQRVVLKGIIFFVSGKLNFCLFQEGLYAIWGFTKSEKTERVLAIQMIGWPQVCGNISVIC